MAALAAAFVWSLNFVVPFVIGHYTVFGFALVRFVVSGAIGAITLTFQHDAMRDLTLRDWTAAAWLAFIGHVGHFLMVAGAAIYAGPGIAPAFLGLIPIVLAIAGNIRHGSVR